MKKYQAIIQFSMDDEFMTLVPSHRTYINYLINKGVIVSYGVSMETLTCWITFHAKSKKEVAELLKKSPLNKYWSFQIEELFVYDSQQYRLPSVQLN
ncbi:MAG: hypothetical protein ACK54Y_05000 [Bacteroidota bacterium]|jgi:hypothetical protein